MGKLTGTVWNSSDSRTSNNSELDKMLEPEFVMAFKLGLLDAIGGKNKPTPIPALKSLQANAKQQILSKYTYKADLVEYLNGLREDLSYYKERYGIHSTVFHAADNLNQLLDEIIKYIKEK